MNPSTRLGTICLAPGTMAQIVVVEQSVLSLLPPRREQVSLVGSPVTMVQSGGIAIETARPGRGAAPRKSAQGSESVRIGSAALMPPHRSCSRRERRAVASIMAHGRVMKHRTGRQGRQVAVLLFRGILFTCLQVPVVAPDLSILRCFTPCANNYTGNEIVPNTNCSIYHEVG